MATATRCPKVNVIGETLTVQDQSDRMRLAARSITVRVVQFLDLVWRREPTLFIELGVLWTIGVWAATILAYGTTGYPPAIAASLGWMPEIGLGVSGAAIAVSQLGAIVFRHRGARGWSSFIAASWLGFLSFAILAGNPRLAGGYVYLGTAAASLLPFWRVVLNRRL